MQSSYVSGAVLVAGLLALVPLACVVSGQDNFECGVRGAGDAITRCDGEGERCLCGDHRCAREEPTCPSGWRYVFSRADGGDNHECVDASLVGNFVLANSSNPLCPDQGPAEQECGTLGEDAGALRCAGSNTFCLCSVRRCAEPWPDCASGVRFVHSHVCIESTELEKGREREDGTCPGVRLDDVFPDAGTPPDAGDGSAPDAGS